MQISNKETPYAKVLRGVEKEGKVMKGLLATGIIPLLAFCARKLVIKI